MQTSQADLDRGDYFKRHLGMGEMKSWNDSKWRYWQHVVAHWLKMNFSEIIIKRDSDGEIWWAIQCKTCGEIYDRCLFYEQKK